VHRRTPSQEERLIVWSGADRQIAHAQVNALHLADLGFTNGRSRVQERDEQVLLLRARVPPQLGSPKRPPDPYLLSRLLLDSLCRHPPSIACGLSLPRQA